MTSAGPHGRLYTRFALTALLLLTIASAIPTPPQNSAITRTGSGNHLPRNRTVSLTEPRPVLSRTVAPRLSPPGWGDTGCMARFEKNETEFDQCKNTTCFLFIQEAPFIILDPSMQTDKEQVLFKCANPPHEFRRLRGAAFEILSHTPAKNALCAWAGPSCAFNHLVNFVREQDKRQKPYMFAITGLLLEYPDRLDANVVPGVSLMQEEMVIIGMREPVPENRFPVGRLVQPFQDKAWLLFACVNLLFVLYAVALAVVFGPRRVTVHGLLQFYLGDYSEADIAARTDAPQIGDVKPPVSPGAALSGALTKMVSIVRPDISQQSHPETSQQNDASPEPRVSEPSAEEEDELLQKVYVARVVDNLATYRVAKRLIQIAFGANFFVFLIFYEIGVVNFLFVERSKPQERKFLNERLAQYAVQKNAATETVFRDTIDPDRTRFPNESMIPWARCTTEGECFEWLLDDSNPVKKFVGFKTIGSYELVTRSACKKLTMFNTEKQLYTFGAGWLYARSVPQPYRRDIDIAILNMQIADTLNSIVQKGVGQLDPRTCNPRITDIGLSIIGVALFFFVTPFLFMCLVLVLWHFCFADYANDSLVRARTASVGTEMSSGDIQTFCQQRMCSSRKRRMHGQGSSSAG